jgi:PPIC-type PPIASE domain
MVIRTKWGSVRWGWGKLALGLSWVGVAGLAFWWGRSGELPQVAAAPPATPPAAQAPAPPVVPPPSAQYTSQVVAYIYDNIPITREDLGEYLIARQGTQKLDLLINKRVIEHACRQQGIEVTEAEIDQALAQDLEGLHLDKKRFVKEMLGQYGKTLYEWREDVLRPKLLMTKLCQGRVKVEEEDLRQGFEAYYGEKVEGRIILWRREEDQIAKKVYSKIRDSEEEFNRLAKQQWNPELAANGGKLKPVGRNTTGTPALEKAMFSLQPGEMTELIETPDGIVVFKCDRRIPPDATAKLEGAVRAKLEKEVIAKKLNQEIPKVFKELRENAKPARILKGSPDEAELEREAVQEVKELFPGGAKKPERPVAPQGN